MGLTKKTMLSWKIVVLKSTLKKFITIYLTMMLIVLILCTEIPGTVMEQKESFDHVTDENHH